MDDTVPTPPKREVDPLSQDLEKIKKERTKLLGDMYSTLAELFTWERNIFIYRAIKGGHISAYQMAKITELSPPVIYKILDQVENGDYK